MSKNAPDSQCGKVKNDLVSIPDPPGESQILTNSSLGDIKCHENQSIHNFMSNLVHRQTNQQTQHYLT